MADQLRRRAVVLDDEAMILIDIQQQLEQLDFDVVACLTDAEAAAAVEATPCDLLIINLGQGDRRRRRFVELATARGIRLIICSSTRLGPSELGGAIFLAKPYSSQDLMDAVVRAFPNP